MIFMRDRRTKKGKDAVAERLGHIALVTMHGVHHELQRRINDRSRFFRIKPFNQGCRTFEVSKQSSDGFALAVRTAPRFQRRLFGSDTLGEVGWSITGGRRG